ncbi:MAG: hypothetical protein H0V09_01860 [Gemmatimonadetes bacterium]|nr:hypothetical protein [Gemmatimonadota bacterium]
MNRSALLPALVPLLAAALACDDGTGPDTRRFPVRGSVQDAVTNTRLRIYDDNLTEQDVVGVQVRPDGSFGPLALPEGTFFAAATASGFTSGQFTRIDVEATEDDTLEIDLDVDPITVPLTVGLRWDYDEITFSPADTSTVTVEIVAQQPGTGVPAVFTVEERRTDPLTGAGQTTTYFLAQDGSSTPGIRKSADTTIDAEDELLLRLPAALGTSWTTVEFESGASTIKRIQALDCNDERCSETDDFVIAQEPAGTFMSVSVLYTADGLSFITVFSDIGIVDSSIQDASGNLILQRKLRSSSLLPGA